MSSKPLYLAVWRLDVTPLAKLIAVRIEFYQRGALGWCTASLDMLAGEVGLAGTTRVRTMARAMSELREANVIEERLRSGATTMRRLIDPTERLVRTPGVQDTPTPGVRDIPHPRRIGRDGVQAGMANGSAHPWRTGHPKIEKIQGAPGSAPPPKHSARVSVKVREPEWLD